MQASRSPPVVSGSAHIHYPNSRTRTWPIDDVPYVGLDNSPTEFALDLVGKGYVKVKRLLTWIKMIRFSIQRKERRIDSWGEKRKQKGHGTEESLFVTQKIAGSKLSYNFKLQASGKFYRTACQQGLCIAFLHMISGSDWALSRSEEPLVLRAANDSLYASCLDI